MSFSERIEDDELYKRIYEKIIFDEFHKRMKQLKQEIVKGTCIDVQDFLLVKVANTVVLFPGSSVYSSWVSTITRTFLIYRMNYYKRRNKKYIKNLNILIKFSCFLSIICIIIFYCIISYAYISIIF